MEYLSVISSGLCVGLAVGAGLRLLRIIRNLICGVLEVPSNV